MQAVSVIEALPTKIQMRDTFGRRENWPETELDELYHRI
jgi:hypothetical protein